MKFLALILAIFSPVLLVSVWAIFLHFAWPKPKP